MKKYLKVIIAAVACIVVVTLIGLTNKPKEVSGSKQISIKIVDGRNEEVVLMNKTFSTDATLLKHFLLELQENEEIKIEYEESDYGMYITAMGYEELIQQDATKGYYWTYESLNNAQCVKDTYCTGADSLSINDGDEFVFSLKGF